MALGYSCKYKNPIYAATEFLKFCKSRSSARTNIAIVLIKDDGSGEYISKSHFRSQSTFILCFISFETLFISSRYSNNLERF